MIIRYNVNIESLTWVYLLDQLTSSCFALQKPKLILEISQNLLFNIFNKNQWGKSKVYGIEKTLQKTSVEERGTTLLYDMRRHCGITAACKNNITI